MLNGYTELVSLCLVHMTTTWLCQLSLPKTPWWIPIVLKTENLFMCLFGNCKDWRLPASLALDSPCSSHSAFLLFLCSHQGPPYHRAFVQAAPSTRYLSCPFTWLTPICPLDTNLSVISQEKLPPCPLYIKFPIDLCSDHHEPLLLYSPEDSWTLFLVYSYFISLNLY